MAHRSQHTLQIMETQTRFDLNAAIADWQLELAAQPGLTSEVRRELETHLRDTIAELQERGLNNEESFWLARRRTGKPRQLGEEFAKEDPAYAWKDRIFWVVVALLLVNLWGNLVSNLFEMSIRPVLSGHLKDSLPGWLLSYLPHWVGELRRYDFVQVFLVVVRLVPVFLLAVFFANRRIKFSHTAFNYVVASRSRFIWISLAATLFVNSFGLAKYGLGFVAFQLPWGLSLITLAVWLIPSRKQSVVKLA